MYSIGTIFFYRQCIVRDTWNDWENIVVSHELAETTYYVEYGADHYFVDDIQRSTK